MRRATIKRRFAEWRQDAIDVPIPDDVPDDEIDEWAVANYDDLFGLAFQNHSARESGIVADIEAHGGDTGPQMLWMDEFVVECEGADDEYVVEVAGFGGSSMGLTR